ncbi:uncharacterized protein TNCV_4428161 [Trichonephila clavipes]|nr:uncharacterized protein TNCV_4428161 [Trichonephila clavipes]
MNTNTTLFSYSRAFGHDLVILNHSQVTRTAPELREEISDFVQSIPGFQECSEKDVETLMAHDAEYCGFQMLNDDEIVTSVQEESDPVDDETDEDEDNNESNKGPSNADLFSALETAME